MKRYHYHPDHTISIRNGDKVYYESLELARFDLGFGLQTPLENTTEFEYIVGYGTRNFTRTDMVSFSDAPRPDLDQIIEDIDLWLQKKKSRKSVTEDVWNIPEDMKTYTPPESL